MEDKNTNPAPAPEPDKPEKAATSVKAEKAFLYEVRKVLPNGKLKVPGATCLKGARINLTKAKADDLNDMLPGCVELIGIR